MEFRDALKMLRNELGLAQADIAIALHINIATVARWEQGKTVPSRSFAIALLDYAKSKSATSECIETLEKALTRAAKQKLFGTKKGLFTVERAAISKLVEDAAFPVYVCDLETDEILYVNHATEKQLGQSVNELTGQKCYECIMHRDKPCESCHKSELVEDCFKGYDACWLDGKTYHAQGKLLQWNGRDAQVRYVLGLGLSELMPNDAQDAEKTIDTQANVPDINDVPRNIKNEEASRRLKTLFENINGGVSVVAYEDNGTVRHAYANDSYYQLFGYTREQYRRELKGYHDTVHPEDFDAVAAAIAKVKETKQALSFRYRIIKRDKSIAYVRCNSSVTSMDGISDHVLISILTDITDSVQNEQQAIVFGQRLDAIMKNMNCAVTATLTQNDGTVKMLFRNDMFEQMLGYTKEQYQAEVSNPFKRVYPDDAPLVRDAALSLRRIGDATELQYRIFTRDGQIKWLQARISLITFREAEEPALLAVYTDVTDAVKAQQQLTAQRDRIANLLNDTPSGIAIVEVDPNDVMGTLHTTFYNDRYISFSGYTRDEYDKMLENREMSFVFKEDAPALVANTLKICRGDIGTTAETTIRCHTKDGGFRYLLIRGQLAERRGDICVIYNALIDITERQEAIERQRISEEMLRIAAETDKRSMVVYDVKNNTCRVESRTFFSVRYGETFNNIPRSLIDIGLTTPDSVDTLCSLFTRIREGEKTVRVSLQLHSAPDTYEWFECNSTTVFDAEGLPDHAILVLHNITEQRIKEAVFRKWQQSIAARPPESYSLFRCNLTIDTASDQKDGKLLKAAFPPEADTFNARTKFYAEEYVFPDDRAAYQELMDMDTLLARFYRGDHSASVDYREIAANGEALWRRLTVETVEYPDSTDVQAFLMFEDINEKKTAEIEALEHAKCDPLTGALNRSAFTEAVNEDICKHPNVPCALIMLDMDGFKQLNDTFGHAAGDQALQEVVAVMRAYTKSRDLVCRLGGDEFMVWLRDMPYDAVIAKTAQQMCDHIRKAYSQEVLLSASIGVAAYPRDGHSYDELYQNADKALYKVKESTKGAYAFYSVIGEEQTQEITKALSEVKQSPRAPRSMKRRLLIVDDSEMSRVMLKSVFKDEYLIETAKNGSEAMIRLRHFGTSVSAVLLDLLMPGVDGFTVLSRMQADVDLRTIPVVVVTGDENRETLLKAFELGAAEYVTKPIDVDIIRMRVQSVISKAENERLRAQNSYLMLQRDEEVKYRTVLESTGTVVIEYNWRNHVFIYGGEITKHIAGNYDHRGLWQVFLSDMVGDSGDVKSLQDTLITLAANREKDRDSMLVKLKTPQGDKHWFRVNFYKNVDDFGLAEKIIITFNDVNEEVLANDKLLFQATRDELTGLYNRAGFLEKAAELIDDKESGYYVMACIDIEKFQVINDRYGTDRGDEVLRHIAATLGGFLQSHGGICCRYAADKFAAMYPAKLLGTDELEEYRLAAAVPSCLPRPLRLRTGRCLVSDTTLPPSTMFDRAVMAEAVAKKRYDTSVVEYDESMRDSILKEQQIVGDMVEALKNGEFEPWFQPQYNHSTGALIGAEALVRWRKDGKIISPNDFIPVFEKNGFIYEVDQYIWLSVCVHLRRWLDEGKNPLPVSVNISRSDMFQENFIDVVTGLVAEYGIPAELLRLEITESAFAADTDTITGIAGRLIDAGFTVEIDDFGSGYSSLNTLKDVPASILKLDMRFFEQSGDAKRGGNIVESVVRMAKWLGMAVIAEGVEDKAQADYLKSIGCFYIQGYLYAKPMPVEEYEKQLTADVKETQLTRMQTLQNLDNNDFWDSRSMDTLIFNSYVGAACILELYLGKVEMLRATGHYVRMLGGDKLDIRDILAIDWTAHMDSQNIRLFTDSAKESMETNESVTGEFEFHGLPGCPETVILRSTLRVIATAGERILIYCLNENITAQRAAERAALHASERINAVMDNSHCGISAVIARRDGTVELLFVNNRFFELLGYTKEQYEAEVKSPYDRLLPEDREKVFAAVTKLTEIGSTTSLEIREMRRDGSVVWLRSDISIVKFANIPESVQIASFLDITRQRENELKQLESARQLEVIMENINGGISAVYSKNNKLEYVVANEQYYRILGYTREEFEADPPDPFELLHPDDRERVKNQFIEGQEALESYTMEYRMVRRDGSLRNILCTTSVVQLLGIDEPVQLAVTNDITELRETQTKELATRERLNTVMDTIPTGITAVTFKDGRLKLLFSNERFYEIHGIKRGQYGDGDLYAAIGLALPEYEELIHKAFSEAERTGQTSSYECRIRRPDGAVRALRVIINIARLVGIDEPVRVAVFSDVTVEKESSDQLRFLNDTAREILAQSDSEQAIHDTLTNLVTFFSADRGYVIELDESHGVLSNTYEVCADGVEPEIKNWQMLPYTTSDYWYASLSHNEFFAIEDVSALDESQWELRDMLLSQGIRSIILVPLWRDGHLIAFIGVDNPSHTFHQMEQLKALADYSSILLTRRDLMRKIQHESETVQQLMDDMPGGLIRMRLEPDQRYVATYCNEGFCKLLGIDSETLFSKYGSDPMADVHPDDVLTVREAILEMRQKGHAHSSRYRLRNAGGDYVWVTVFGRFSKDQSGNTFLNLYYTDETINEKATRYREMLMDNFPWGMGAYGFRDGQMSLIYQNKNYWEFVGLSEDRIPDPTPMSAIHPDDVPMVMKKLAVAIENHEDVICDIRLRHLELGFRPVRLVARVVPNEIEGILIVASFIPKELFD